MARTGIKKEAHQLIDELPDDATWEELEYKIHVRRKIEAGVKSLDEGQSLSTDEVREQLGGDRDGTPRCEKIAAELMCRFVHPTDAEIRALVHPLGDR